MTDAIGAAEPRRRARAASGRDPDEPSMVIFTSGTTSRPKGVVHSLNTMLAATRNFVDPPALTAADNIFMISPLASVTGMLQAITVAPSLGAQVTDRVALRRRRHLRLPGGDGRHVLRRSRSPARPRPRPGRGARRHRRADHLGVPRRLHARPAHPRPRRARVRHRRAPRLRLVGGAGLAPPAHAGSRRRSASADDGAPLGGVEVRIGSRADPGRVLHRWSRTCSSGTSTPTTTPHAFDDDWFLTGDLAELRDGRLKISGRIKDIVIRNGLNIPIAEVDGLVAALPGVVQCAGYGVADDTTGERLAMAVRLAARRVARVRRDGRRPGRAPARRSGRSPRSSCSGTSRSPRPRRARCSATCSRRAAPARPGAGATPPLTRSRGGYQRITPTT